MCRFPGSLVEDKDERPLERTSSVSEEYMRYLDNPQNVEKRFPVDRRKLEELIKGMNFLELNILRWGIGSHGNNV